MTQGDQRILVAVATTRIDVVEGYVDRHKVAELPVGMDGRLPDPIDLNQRENSLSDEI